MSDDHELLPTPREIEHSARARCCVCAARVLRGRVFRVCVFVAAARLAARADERAPTPEPTRTRTHTPEKKKTKGHCIDARLTGNVARFINHRCEPNLYVQPLCAEDQRRVMVSLSARSRSLAGLMAPQIEAMYGRLEAHIGPQIVSRHYASLDELITLLGELPEPGVD